MTVKAADDFDSIAQRLKELGAEKELALTGTSVPMAQEKDDTPQGYGDYLAGMGSGVVWVGGGVGLKSAAYPNWPYAGTGFEWRRFVRS